MEDDNDLYLIEFWMDGYEDDEERQKAQEEFIYDQLNMTASSVTVTKYDPKQARAEVIEEVKNMISKHRFDMTSDSCEVKDKLLIELAKLSRGAE